MGAVVTTPNSAESRGLTTAACVEVYDYVIRDTVPVCNLGRGHEGPHRWTGEDGLNRVTLEWEWLNVG